MSGVECRGLPTLTMAVDELGTMVIARDAILRVVAPLRARFAGEPKMDARLKKMDSWIPGLWESLRSQTNRSRLARTLIGGWSKVGNGSADELKHRILCLYYQPLTCMRVFGFRESREFDSPNLLPRAQP